MTPRRPNPKIEYRRQQSQRVSESVSLAEKFPKLKSLTLDIAYFDPDGVSKHGELRYKVNVQHAKSVFSFACPNGECLGGDFDLSAAMAEAVAKRRKMVEGEVRCQGVRTKPKQEVPVACRNLLRYKLILAYT